MLLTGAHREGGSTLFLCRFSNCHRQVTRPCPASGLRPSRNRFPGSGHGENVNGNLAAGRVCGTPRRGCALLTIGCMIRIKCRLLDQNCSAIFDFRVAWISPQPHESVIQQVK